MTAAISLLSKYLIRVDGRHLFNPSNIGLVIVFLALGPLRAEPLDFWWGPRSPSVLFAAAVIVIGGFLILRRLRLLSIALTFWVTFAAALGVVSLAGSLHHRTVARRPAVQPRVLDDHRHVARAADLPVLHDHGSAHDPDRSARGGRCTRSGSASSRRC